MEGVGKWIVVNPYAVMILGVIITVVMALCAAIAAYALIAWRETRRVVQERDERMQRMTGYLNEALSAFVAGRKELSAVDPPERVHRLLKVAREESDYGALRDVLVENALRLACQEQMDEAEFIHDVPPELIEPAVRRIVPELHTYGPLGNRVVEYAFASP